MNGSPDSKNSNTQNWEWALMWLSCCNMRGVARMEKDRAMQRQGGGGLAMTSPASAYLMTKRTGKAVLCPQEIKFQVEANYVSHGGEKIMNIE